MITKSARATASGKVILLGEYAVLEGAPALVAAVDRFCKVQVKKNGKAGISLNSVNLNLPELSFLRDVNGKMSIQNNGTPPKPKETAFLSELVRHLTEVFEDEISGASISIDTCDFYHKKTGNKFGLGSSAALTVALIRAMNEYTGAEPSDETLFAQAMKAHHAGQSRLGSGVDIAASAAGGVIKYRMPGKDISPEDTIEPLSWPEDLQMFAIWTGESASTRMMLRTVGEFKNDEPAAYYNIIREMTGIAEEGIQAFKEGDSDAFLEFIHRYYEKESELGKRSGTNIISEAHQEIHKLVSGCGGHYKPSGAGGGDIGVAFCNTDSAATCIKEGIAGSRFSIIDLAVQPAEPLYQHYEN